MMFLPRPSVSHALSHRFLLTVICLAFACIYSIANAQSEAKYKFDISAREAESALKKFSDQSGQGLIMNADTVAGVQTNAVKGEFTASDALAQMLSGTGLVATRDEKSGSFVVHRENESPKGQGAALMAMKSSRPEGAPSAEQSKDENQPTILSDFLVTATPTTGYGETNSYTATRVGLPIMDTPLSIQVVTAQQLRDRGAITFNDAFTYTSNISVDGGAFTGISYGNNDSTTERGFQMLVLRDGFMSPNVGTGLQSNLNIENADRIEIIKGPDTVFFGAASPGGIIDVISKKPQDTPSASLDYTAGSYGYNKTRLDITGPVKGLNTVDYRLFAEYQDSDGWVDYTYARSKIVTPSVTWKPTKELSINVQYNYDYEKYNQLWYTTFGNNQFLADYASPPQNLLTSLGFTASQAQARWLHSEPNWAADVLKATGQTPYWLLDFQSFLAPQGARFNPGGPDAFQAGTENAITGEVDYTLNDAISLRYGFFSNSFDSTFLLPGLGLNNGDGTIGINPSAGGFDERQLTHQLDALFKYDFPFLKNKILAGYLYERNKGTNLPIALNTSAYPATLGGPSALSNYNPYTMPAVRLGLIPETPAASAAVGSTTVTESGYAISWSGAWFDGRLNTLAGIRFDKDDSIPSGLAGLLPVYATDTLPMAGATFRVVKGLSLFASYSKTYTPTSELSITGSGVVPSDNAHLLPPETGSGYDFGIKVDAFDSRLTGTLSFFQDERSGIASENLAATDADPRGFTGSRTIIDWTSGGLERTRGVEADFIYHVTQNYMFLFAGSYMPYAKTVTDPSTAPGSYIYQIEITDGRRLQNAPEQMVSIWNKYDFTTGPLRNFSVGAGLRYSSEIIPENNNLWGIVDPSFVTCEAMISYHTRTFGRSLTVQLNGRNLGNVTYYQGGIVQAPPREIFVNVALGF